MSNRNEIKDIHNFYMDTNSSKNTIKDGACEVAHNLSVREGLTRSVCAFKHLSTASSSGVQLAFIHPLLSEGEYVGINGRNIVKIITINGNMTLTAPFFTLSDEADLSSTSFSYFEEYLFLRYTINSEEYREIFSYDGSNFTHLSYESNRQLSHPTFTYSYMSPVADESGLPASRIATYTLNSATIVGEVRDVYSVENYYPELLSSLAENNYIYGVVYLIFVVNRKDGTKQTLSDIYMLESEASSMSGTTSNSYTFYSKNISSVEVDYYKQLIGFKVEIDVTNIVPEEERDTVDSITIYSTRAEPTYDLDNLNENFPTSSDEYALTDEGYLKTSSKHFFTKDAKELVHSPFYEIANIDLQTSDSVFLSLKDYTTLETNDVFLPSVAPHAYCSKNGLSINQRWYQFNISAKLCKPSVVFPSVSEIYVNDLYYELASVESTVVKSIGINVNLKVNGEYYSTQAELSPKVFEVVERSSSSGRPEGTGEYAILLPNLISYPDVRATELEVYLTRETSTGDKHTLLKNYTLTSVASNNYAYYIDSSRNSLVGYEAITISDYTGSFSADSYTPPSNSNCFAVANQLMVSEQNIPNLFYPSHVYHIGDNLATVIEDINIPLDQITETRFGQYPLYLFTNSGTYAMEQGSGEVLYQSIVKINNSFADSNTNSIGALNSIFYLSQNRVYQLSGTSYGDISEDIHPSLLSYGSSAVLRFSPMYNELLVINSNYNYAFCFSFASKKWFTRDWSGTMLDTTNILVVSEGDNSYSTNVSVYTLKEEDTTLALPSHVITREMSFASPYAKRIRRLLLKLITNDEYNVTLSGSLDASSWNVLTRKTDTDTLTRLASSWRWFKIEISGGEMILDSIIFTYFNRFSRYTR